MSRFLSLLIVVTILASMALGATAHASERICLPAVEASAVAGHADGDGDQVPADSEKGFPHHHGGCHAHHVAAPLDRAAQSERQRAGGQHIVGTTITVVTAPTDPALRPPIA